MVLYHLDEENVAVDAYIAQNELHLSTYQRDALVSLTYNIGQSWTRSGSYTALRHMLSAHSDDLILNPNKK